MALVWPFNTGFTVCDKHIPSNNACTHNICRQLNPLKKNTLNLQSDVSTFRTVMAIELHQGTLVPLDSAQ